MMHMGSQKPKAKNQKPKIGQSPRPQLISAFGVLVFGFAFGCHPSDREIDSFLHEREASVSSSEYIVQPPDTLEISSAQAAESEGERQRVRQDGKITLRLLGEVKVAGMTPS